MNKQQISQQKVELAVNTGLELIRKKSSLPVPLNMQDGVDALREFLVLIVTGQLIVAPLPEQASPKPEGEPAPE